MWIKSPDITDKAGLFIWRSRGERLMVFSSFYLSGKEFARRRVVFDAKIEMAEGRGFEPRLTGPEPVVLPLDDPPADVNSILFNGKMIVKIILAVMRAKSILFSLNKGNGPP